MKTWTATLEVRYAASNPSLRIKPNISAHGAGRCPMFLILRAVLACLFLPSVGTAFFVLFFIFIGVF